ncbi:MAG: SEC-C domain-containing protein, partial [Firmicutes bacterium]|nr:SEC-C domain-containing protein [Bacillota bacterium]
RYFGIENFSDPDNMEINHHVLIALKAHAIMKRDVDYIEHEGEIVIVDEFTGRLMFGRRYNDGLHQAIEAKEGINIRNESRTLATITLQNYFRMYGKLAGMTGTAKTEELEFTDIYNMKVIVIPTNKPVIRDDMDDSVYTTQAGKFRAIIDDVVRRHETGQPVLVGTVSVEKSEILSDMLKKRGVPHNVLNAKQHMREAEIVAQAGRLGAVTIATNMAGRGTDILLGGNPEFEAKKEMRKLGYEEEAISAASSFVDLTEPELIEAREKFHSLLDQFSEVRKGDAEKVKELGGLHIIGSERHEARRIDNQLRGRSGRQGDPGSSQFYVALDDDLMRLFGGDRAQSMMSKMGLPDDEPLETGILTKSIESAQKKVEGRNFAARKYVLQYDDVMNRQRTVIYAERKRVLMGEDLQEHVVSMMRSMADEMAEAVTIASQYPEEWDFAELNAKLKAVSDGLPALEYKGEALMSLTKESLAEDILKLFTDLYAEKEKQVGSQQMRELERMIMLYVVDLKWMDHIDAMDQLKSGIGLRSLGQQNPAQAYANEGADMFELMVNSIREDMVKNILRITVETRTERRQVAGSGTGKKDAVMSAADEERAKAKAAGSVQARPQGPVMPRPQNVSTNAGTEKPKPIRVAKTPGRNDPCPCGSGKKYKNCCGRNV